MWNRVGASTYLVESTSGEKIWVDRVFESRRDDHRRSNQILREYSEWRRDDSEMIDPAIIGKAIDMVLRLRRRGRGSCGGEALTAATIGAKKPKECACTAKRHALCPASMPS